MSLSKHILIITPGFARDEDDDFTIPVLQEYVQGIAKYRPHWKLSIIALHFPYSKGTYKYKGFKVFTLNGSNKKWKKPFLYNAVLKKAKALHKDTPIDMVHSFWLTDAALIAQRLSSLLNLPHVCSAQGQDVFASNRYLRLLDIDKLKLVFMSQLQAQKSVISHKESSHVIHAGLGSIEFHMSEKSIDVLGAGNLIDVKNWPLFIQVLAEVKKSFPGLKAKLLGEGPLESELKLLAAKYGLSDNLEITGKRSRSETLKLMQSSKVLLHTSKSEGFGVIYAEALQSACHIVTTPVGVASEIETARMGSGVLDLSTQVVDALNSELPETQNPFGIERMITNYEKVYGFDE